MSDPTIHPADLGIGELFERIRDAIIVADARTQRVVLWNPAATKIFGYSVSEALELRVEALVPAHLKARHRSGITHYGQTGHGTYIDSHALLELPAVKKGGEEIDVELSLSPIDLVHDSNGGGRFVLAVIRDITKRKRAENELGRYAAEVADLYNNAPCGYHSLDEEGTFIAINDTELAWLGYAREEVVGRKKFSDIVTERSLRTFRENYPRFKERGWIRDLEFELVRKDGTLMWALLSATAIKDAAGNFVASRSTFLDITKRKRAEELRSKLAAIVDSSDDAIIGKTLDGTITSWNAGAEKVYGYTADEVVGYPISVLAPADRPDEMSEILDRVKRGEKVDHLETVRMRKDGRHIHVSLTVSPVRDAAGNITGAATIARDVTKRREAEELRRQRDFYETLLKIQSDMGEGLMIVSDERIVYTNEAFSRISGYSPGELATLPSYLELIVSEERPRVDERLRRRPEDPLEDHYETAILNKSGQRVDLEIAVKTFSVNGDTQLVAITSDITERKRAEENLKRSLNALLTLHESSRVFSSTLQSDEIGHRLLQMARRVSDLEAAVIFLQDEDGQVRLWQNVGSEGLLEQAHGAPEAQSARAAALEAGERRTFELRRPGAEEGSLVGVCLPLRVRDWGVGVLETYGPETLGEGATIELLSSLANQAASALENARLYGELAEHEKRLRVLVGKLIAAQEEERTRVAYELHDGPTQVAIAAHQHLQAFADDHPPGSTVNAGELDRVLELAQQTAVETRRVIGGLRPTALDDFGLAAAIRLQVESLCADGWEISYDETLGDERLPVEIETALYRVAQEALTNVRKHARTTRVRITLARRGRMIHMEIRDQGRGFDPSVAPEWSGPGERVGLSSMHERVALLGGSLVVRSQPGEGTSVAAEVPLPASGEMG